MTMTQPKPIDTHIWRLEVQGKAVICRHWEPADVPSCTRCEQCTANRGVDWRRNQQPAKYLTCAVTVPDEDLYLFAF